MARCIPTGGEAGPALGLRGTQDWFFASECRPADETGAMNAV